LLQSLLIAMPRDVAAMLLGEPAVSEVRLYCYKLEAAITGQDLVVAFEEFGEVTHAFTPRAGFGFVTFADRLSAITAFRYARTTGVYVHGCRIFVQWAVERAAPHGNRDRNDAPELPTETPKRQRENQPLADAMRKQIIAALSPNGLQIGEVGQLLYGTYAPQGQQADARALVQGAGSLKSWLSSCPEFELVDVGTSTWVKRARSAAKTSRTSATSSTSAVSSSGARTGGLHISQQPLEELMKRRLFNAIPPNGNGMQLGEVCNHLYGHWAPLHERARARELVQGAGGPTQWLMSHLSADVDIMQCAGGKWVSRLQNGSSGACGVSKSPAPNLAPHAPSSAPPSASKALSKSKAPRLALGATEDVTLEFLTPRAINLWHAERLATASSCSLLKHSSTPPGIELRGTPAHLGRAAAAILSLHEAKDGLPRLTLSADSDQIGAVHGESSAGLLELKAQTMCKITINASEGGMRKIQLQRSEDSKIDAKQAIVDAVVAIAERWQQCSCNGLSSPAHGSCCGAASSEGAGSSAPAQPAATPLKRSHEAIPLGTSSTDEEQLKKRRLRFATMPPPALRPSAAKPAAASETIGSSRSPAHPAPPTEAQPVAASGSVSASLAPHATKEPFAARGESCDGDALRMKLAQSEERISALEGRVETLLQEQAVQQAVQRESRERTFHNQLVAVRGYVQLLREKSGKGAGDKWSNFIVRRELAVPSLKQSDIGKTIDIGGKLSESLEEIELKSGPGVAASKHRLVIWEDCFSPSRQIEGAKIIAVEERINGTVEIVTRAGEVDKFSNPSSGLVTDVLGFMMFGTSSRGFTRQDLFRPTEVSFEAESGVDMAGDGGLSQDMYGSFWRAVISKDLGLFENADSALPACDASEERLELVGLFLCKSIIDEKLIGRGLCPFLFEFLLDETSRTFDASKPMREQVSLALNALAEFDPVKAKNFRDVLNAFRSGSALEVGFDLFTIGQFVLGDPDGERPVTTQNIEETIVKGCREILWMTREKPLLALRKGFSTREVITKEPIDLATILRPFTTPDLMVLVQGRGIDGTELVTSCIEWPESSAQARLNANFPDGSTTPRLLKALLSDGNVSAADFLRWSTGRREVPFGGLAATEGQRIKLRYNDCTVIAADESKWPLPQARTCVHTVTLANFTNRDVLLDKLRMAIEHIEEGFQRDD